MTSLRISANIRTVYLRALFSLPISTLDMLPTGQTAAIITTVANNLQLGISEKFSSIFSGAAMILGSLAVAFLYDWLLTLATSTGLLLVVAVYYSITPRITGILGAVLEQDIKASGVAAEALTPSAARMLAACGAGDKIVARYAGLVDEGHRRGQKMASLVALQNGLSEWWPPAPDLEPARTPPPEQDRVDANSGQYILEYTRRPVYVSTPTGGGILANYPSSRTFSVAFWYAFQMYMLMEIDSPEPLIV